MAFTQALGKARAILALLVAGALPMVAPPAGNAQAEGAKPAFKGTAPELLQELKAYPYKIAYEAYRDGNFDIFLMNADGSNNINLTKTPDMDELYPKASPDGKKLCFYADEGKGKDKKRNLYLMNIDGSGRKKIADTGREPCWSADGQSIAFLKGEFTRYDLMDYATKGIFIYDLKTGQTRPHPNADNIKHLYCLNWSKDGKWFVATVHGGMGFSHAILALEAQGSKVFNLHLDGCRPDISPDQKHVAWGNGDYAMGVADLDLSGATPTAKWSHNAVQSKDPMKTYHADWSPDGHYLAFSYGDKLDEKALGAVPEIPGIRAAGWNICVADDTGKNRWVIVTPDGASCKEPEWVPAAAGDKK